MCVTHRGMTFSHAIAIWNPCLLTTLTRYAGGVDTPAKNASQLLQEASRRLGPPQASGGWTSGSVSWHCSSARWTRDEAKGRSVAGYALASPKGILAWFQLFCLWHTRTLKTIPQLTSMSCVANVQSARRRTPWPVHRKALTNGRGLIFFSKTT